MQRTGTPGQLTGLASFDVTGRLAEIRIPTLVMHGAQDRIVPAANAQRLADGIAGARLVIFPDAGHVITDATQAANQEVLHFLAWISRFSLLQHRPAPRQPTRWTREPMTDPLVPAGHWGRLLPGDL